MSPVPSRVLNSYDVSPRAKFRASVFPVSRLRDVARDLLFAQTISATFLRASLPSLFSAPTAACGLIRLVVGVYSSPASLRASVAKL
jgi:hypothetical protein